MSTATETTRKRTKLTGRTRSSVDAVFFLPVWPDRPRTGGEIYNRKLVDGLKKQGYRIQVVTLMEMRDGERWPSPRAIYTRLKALEPVAPVLVFDTWLYRFLWSIVLRLRTATRFKLVSFSQLCYWETFRSLPHRSLHRALTLAAQAPAHHHVGVSRTLLARDLGWLRRRSRCTVIHPGSDYADRPLPAADLNREPVEILSVGNYDARKGYHVLVEALVRLKHDRPDLLERVRLRLLGNRLHDPAYVERLERRVAEEGLDERVMLEDWKSRAEVSRLFTRAQLFAFASSAEGFGMVVLEAMLHGLPVLLGDFGVARELLGSPAEAGWIVPGNRSTGFAERIADYVACPDRTPLGRAARARGQELALGWDHVATRFGRVLERLAPEIGRSRKA